ncbi:N-succinylglutamate 5-semialdehyde dehydrogenase [Candidatus Marinamargulisbacteria bacterium SCGC AG-414-C22]|nr:N-succinylglutamate 5-semialdehyde dehydrogenase [Candidatus Marinamargulisbacteria bacterium SCGC AG-414-C22]
MINKDYLIAVNPSTEEELESFPVSQSYDINLATVQARKVFAAWSQLSFEERVLIINRFKTLLADDSSSLTQLISQETGKTLTESQQEVTASIAKIDISIDAYIKRSGKKSFRKGDFKFELTYKPLGVLVVLGPFNFPLHLPNGHIVPSLLAGNCVLFKPSEHTFLVGKRYVELWQQAGLPKGVLQCLCGGKEVGEKLYKHQDIDGVLFTGGYNTGKQISSYLGQYPEKLLALELGGNNPLVIAQTDLSDAVIQTIIQSAYLTTGQRCTCANRLIVVNQPGIKDFEKQLIESINSLRYGCFDDDPAPFMGPLITAQARQHVLQHYETVVASGARVLVPLQKPKGVGYFCSPGLVDVTDVDDVADDECFGPLLHLMYVDDLDAAIRVANDTKYGLSASLISQEESEFELFYRNVKAGIINYNRPTNGASSQLPFGGVGRSGNYRPSAYFAADYCSYPVAGVHAEFL